MKSCADWICLLWKDTSFLRVETVQKEFPSEFVYSICSLWLVFSPDSPFTMDSNVLWSHGWPYLIKYINNLPRKCTHICTKPNDFLLFVNFALQMQSRKSSCSMSFKCCHFCSGPCPQAVRICFIGHVLTELLKMTSMRKKSIINNNKEQVFKINEELSMRNQVFFTSSFSLKLYQPTASLKQWDQLVLAPIAFCK